MLLSPGPRPSKQIICMTLKLIALRLVGSLQNIITARSPPSTISTAQLWEYELRKYMQQRRTEKNKRKVGTALEGGLETWRRTEKRKWRKDVDPPGLCSYKFGRVFSHGERIEQKEKERMYEVGNVHEGKVVQRCNGFFWDAWMK